MQDHIRNLLVFIVRLCKYQYLTYQFCRNFARKITENVTYGKFRYFYNFYGHFEALFEQETADITFKKPTGYGLSLC